MLLPWRDTWASLTPNELMRLLMMLMASLSVSVDTFFLAGWSTTETPPWRSRPRNGRLSVTIV